ncbi:MAG: amidophosphoribosyltransferase [Eubacterium sp.]|nr:amidophosphoribosyltransferase [Candidatus Colimonas fimequi]
MYDSFYGIREECGVLGIWSKNDSSIAKSIYYGLLSLQHRGQEAAGIAVCDTKGNHGNLNIHKDMGLVSEVFTEDRLKLLKGNIGIGHVRYSTTGDSNVANAQPFASYYLKGTLALVHNGNIVNSNQLKTKLMNEGIIFKANTDTEVIEVLLAQKRAKAGSIESAVKETVSELVGGYALIIMSPRKLVAVRDSLGLKPMCIGKYQDGWIIASESCALSSLGAEFIRDVKPGEIITISDNGIVSDTSLCPKDHAHCVFEYIYFARLDSVIDSHSVYSARFRSGQMLAKAYPIEADIVSGVPESGLTAAAGYAYESGIPNVNVFYKNGYLGRTFIKPTQEERISAVHMKLNVVPELVKDKRIVIIDDSIVRGNTMANLVNKLRDAGAKEVHVRISSPPFLYPCYYGTDVPDNSQLIATQMFIDDIRKAINSDSLGYMKLEDLDAIVPGLPLCKACFNGLYPTSIDR